MGKVEIWDSLPSFRMWPKKTFFGLDKRQTHCFTLPKATTDAFIRYFKLHGGKLQSEIKFIIRDLEYDAEIRLVRIDRSKPYKLESEDLPKRIVIQFQWVKDELTQIAIRGYLREIYDLIFSESKNDNHSVSFLHAGGSKFVISFDNFDPDYLSVGSKDHR